LSVSSESHRIVCHLDKVLADRGMTLTELSQRTGLTMANLSILKTNKAKAVRFTTLTTICDVLATTPGELFDVMP
jgi:putative transcriptional regulator